MSVSWIGWVFSLVTILVAIGIVSVNQENEEEQPYPDLEANFVGDVVEFNEANTLRESSVDVGQTSTVKRFYCPAGFTYFETAAEGLCYMFISASHPYPPNCPYKNFLAHDYSAELYDQFRAERIWVRANRRNILGQFGQFIWTEPSQRYGEVITEYTYEPEEILNANCMTVHDGILKATNCNETHKALCIYSIEYNKISRYCSQKNPSDVCINSDINIDSGNCFCRSTRTEIQSRLEFCDKLAEPISPYQSLLVLRGLPNNLTCWFGLYKDAKGNFRWSSSGDLIKYHIWTNTTNFNKSFGAIQFGVTPGWTLEDDKTLYCGLCELTVKSKTTSVRLTSSPDSSFVVVYITNPIDLSNYFGNHYMFFCFSDAHNNDFMEKLTNYISNVPGDNSRYKFTIPVRNEYPATFWCEGHIHPNMTFFLSNFLVTYKGNNRYRTNYAIQAYVRVPPDVDPFMIGVHTKACEEIKNRTAYLGIIQSVRPIRVLKYNDEHIHLLIHLSTFHNNLSIAEESEILFDHLQMVVTNISFIYNISNFANSFICLPSKTNTGGVTLHWPQTTIGTTTIPYELCLQENGMPVVRTCEGNFSVGGQWTEVKGECANVSYPETLLALHRLLYSWNYTTDNIESALYFVTTNISEALHIEVHLISQLLYLLANNNQDLNITTIVYIVNALMEYDSNLLKETQLMLNSTDKILDATDRILSNVDNSDDEEHLTIIRTKNVIIQIADLVDVRGLALLRTSNKLNSFDSLRLETLYGNTSEEILYNDNLEIAAYVPPVTFNEILEFFNYSSKIKIVISVFYNHRLFNSNKNDTKSDSIIVSVTIPGLVGVLSSTISLIFRSNNSENSACAFWKYGTNELMNNIKGSWSSDIDPKYLNISHVICQVDHLTHFSLLVMGSSSNEGSEENVANSLALGVITIVGSTLSLMGLLAIFITAVVFRRWRKHSGNAIILNFSICIAIQISLLFVADNINDSGTLCILAGILLHYFTLSEFFWMLVIAILQYRKFVVVFHQQTSHLVAKACVFGWGCPLIPIFIFLIISPKGSYQKNSYGLCYPVDNFYYYGILLPVFVVVVINIAVFALILNNICSRKVKAYGAKAKDMKLQFLLAFMLFFLLGMSWTFGLLTAFGAGIVFSYLFCFMATLQGFVMFIFFIVINDSTRTLWLNFKNMCCCKERYVQRRVSAHFSTTSISTVSTATVTDEPKFK